MAMDETRILPGDVLVSNGALKIKSSLPEVGLKDVKANGSWLEQKQVQAALDNRKQLIGLERIEKSGVLSHAEWREDLMLAEVTQKVGSYWQYIGHNVGKQLFLYPEEALFLMEVNCLLLKYDEVKVSLQQAYTLLLRSKISLLEYKVYASLSRLGYRVYRHQIIQKSEPTDYEDINMVATTSKAHIFEMSRNNGQSDTVHGNNCSDTTIVEIHENVPKKKQDKTPFKPPADKTDNQTGQAFSSEKEDESLNKAKISKYIQHKINKLKCRIYKTSRSSELHNYFENIPNFGNNSVISIIAPESRYLPGNMKLKCSSYILNVEKMCKKPPAPEVTPTTSNTRNDSICTPNQPTERPIRYPPVAIRQNFINSMHFRIAPQCNISKKSSYWNTESNIDYFNINVAVQAPLMYPQLGPRLFLRPLKPNINQVVHLKSTKHDRAKKRAREHSKKEHFDSIQKLSRMVKKTTPERREFDPNVSKLRQLIQSYNTEYKAQVYFSEDFTVYDNVNIIETIELEDDDDKSAKKSKIGDDEHSFNDKLEKLREVARKMKDLESNNKATTGHKRMFAKLMKRFNTSYKVDYYVNDNFDVIKRNDLTLHSSSSDAVEITEVVSQPTTSKKLKNPFSILKQISDKQKEQPCISTNMNEMDSLKPSFNYNPITKEIFKNGWLPDVSDFGRAEIISNNLAKEIIHIRKEEFLFDFMKIQPEKFNSWLDVKILFLQCLRDSSELFNYGEAKRRTGRQIGSLAKPEDFTDAASLLKKLSIIKSHKQIDKRLNLAVDFDVYNRDVQNFKKSNRPLPHFRVVCIKESSALPSGANVVNLHSKYKDDVTIIFAVVGTGSISYLQVNPVDLPLYIPNNSNTV